MKWLKLAMFRISLNEKLGLPAFAKCATVNRVSAES